LPLGAHSAAKSRQGDKGEIAGILRTKLDHSATVHAVGDRRSCLRRVKLLEEAGVIDRYVAVLNPARIGRGQTFFTRIWLKQQDEDTIEHFAAEVAKFPEVMECYLMLGDCDAMVRIVAAGIDDYRRFQSEHLSRIKGVQNVKTDVPSQTIKQTSEMPL